MAIQVLHRDDLTLGGFAGLTEHRLVVDKKVGGGDDSWDGMGNFVYLADAVFEPHGETRLHPHKELDVISIMVEGRIHHEGSLEHGKSMLANQVQAQRAGGEGFEHNEINPDDQPNRMLQLWVLPETAGEAASYKFYDLKPGELTRIYGGDNTQADCLDSHTIMEVGNLTKGQEITKNGEFMVYIAKGCGTLNAVAVNNGDLIRGHDFDFIAAGNDTLFVVVTTE